MKLSRFIFLALLPIFLLLGLANAYLLVASTAKELAASLDEQAAAAVTAAAEYFASDAGLTERAASGQAQAALRIAAPQMARLASLYVVAPSGKTITLLGAAPASDMGVPKPLGFLVKLRERNGAFFVTARRQLPDRRIVGVELHAEAAVRAQYRLFLEAALILLASCLIAGVLTKLLSAWLSRDVERIRAFTEDGGVAHDGGEFTFKETREAADAVQLLKQNLDAEAGNVRYGIASRERARTLDAAIGAAHRERFPGEARTIHGVSFSVGPLAGSSADCFYAIIDGRKLGGVLLGRMAAPSAMEALAHAVQARASLEAAGDLDSAERKLDLLREHCGLEDLEGLLWDSDANLLRTFGETAASACPEACESLLVIGPSRCIEPELAAYLRSFASGDHQVDLHAMNRLWGDTAGLIARVSAVRSNDVAYPRPLHQQAA